ncbi:MAG: hypothetical protein V9E98_09440 [Candidatus Nanopelagicales bacterium]
MTGDTVPLGPGPQSPSGTDAQKQIEQLQAEVDRLRGQLSEQSGPTPKPARTGSRWRSFWSAVLIIVACIMAPLSVVAVWARGEVTDTDRYVATVAPLASDPAVQQAVSDRVSDELLAQVDIPALTQEFVSVVSDNRKLTPRQEAALTALEGPVNSGIEGFIRDKVTQVIQSPQFASVWTQANTQLHMELNSVLSGENSGAVSIEGDKLVLNVGDVVEQVKTELVADGFSVASKIPAVDAQIVLAESNSIAEAQSAYSALNTIGVWLPIIAAILAILGILVANTSRKAVLGLGIGLTLAMFVSALAVASLRAGLIAELPEASSAAAATAILDQVTLFLRQALWAGFAAGIVLILAAVFTGPSRFATGVRGLFTRAAGAIQGQLASWGASMDSVRHWVAAQATGLRIAATIAAIAIIIIQRYKTVELILWTTAGLLVVLFIIQIFASGERLDSPVEDGEAGAGAST